MLSFGQAEEFVMGPLKKHSYEGDGGVWPPLVEFDSAEEVDDETLDRIRKAANAPAEDDPNWVVVDGPGW